MCNALSTKILKRTKVREPFINYRKFVMLEHVRNEMKLAFRLIDIAGCIESLVVLISRGSLVTPHAIRSSSRTKNI